MATKEAGDHDLHGTEKKEMVDQKRMKGRPRRDRGSSGIFGKTKEIEAVEITRYKEGRRGKSL